MNVTTLVLFLVLVLSIGLTHMASPFLRRYAFRMRILDRPGGHKNHTRQIPLLGGVAMWFGLTVSVVFSLGALYLLAKLNLLEASFSERYLASMDISAKLLKIVAIIIGATALGMLGFYDDTVKNGLHYRTKFIVQFLAAAALVASGLYVQVFPWQWLNMLISLFWIVGITNAFNLLDGMDGLAAGVAAISATGFLLLTVSYIPLYAAIVMAGIIGCCIGFLRYNFYPARVFMGDAGSLLLGFLMGVVAIIALNSAQPFANGTVAVVPLLLLSIPIYDTFSVIVIRLRERRHPFVGDQNHFFHRLVQQGLSKRNTVVLLYSLNLVAVATAYSMFHVSWLGCSFFVTLTVALYACVPRFVSMFQGKAIPAPSTSVELPEPKRVVLVAEGKQLVGDLEPEFDDHYLRERRESYTTG
ncbi:MAG: MraY family glycosyltransferase [bacterium]